MSKNAWDHLKDNLREEGDPVPVPPPDADLLVIYRYVMGGDFAEDSTTTRYTVRLFDGMDGCWCDLLEATGVSFAVALRIWGQRTKRGTEKTNFNHIDYYSIFRADTHMAWDGSEGREMFR
jgi:hypothetical protein